ncbi:hypothetical protein HJFPF1_09680 [Paramyrothecium foliicola]|nr:hypothetical protein HJFPF1_09680 [Paramyrothecium foliicola]
METRGEIFPLPTWDYPSEPGAALANAVIGKEIYYFCGNRVLEHVTSKGELRALKVRSRKGLKRTEGDLMQHAATHGILAPRVYGVYGVKTSYTLATVLVSDRVPGSPLVDVWQTLEKNEKESVKQQLREQFSRMRSCTQPYIGSLGRRPAHNVYSRIVPEEFGPFEDEEAFDNWCFARLKCLPHTRWKWNRYLKKMREKNPSKFVLTHGDLTPRNIMVQGSTVTGIIDWERGGFFPEYCEYAWAMKLCHEHEKWWLPVLKEILEPCPRERIEFTGMVEDRGW